jgi:chromosome segregation ATPase
MATKDPEIADLTVFVLREIRDEVKKSNERLGRVEAEMTGMRGEMTGMREEQRETNARLTSLEEHVDKRFEQLEAAAIDGFTGVRRELDKVNQRLDGLRDIAGEANRENRQRIERVEARVDKLEAAQR